MLKEAADKALKIVGQTQDLVVISPRSLADALNQEAESLNHVLQPWVRRGAFRWIDVSAPSIQRWVIHNNAAREASPNTAALPIRYEAASGINSDPKVGRSNVD